VTINDLELSALMTTIKLKAACLQTWCANGKEQRLFTEFMEIEKAAKDAQLKDEVRQGLRAASGADGDMNLKDGVVIQGCHGKCSTPR
jgi:hypothetical protein